MASIAQGIVGGEMAWPLVVAGIGMGFALILVRVKSPMLFSVGMYLPLETTFAIFVGGMVRGFVDRQSAKRGHNAAQKARVENAGVLTASGLIAGEALMGLVAAGVVAFKAYQAASDPSVADRLPAGAGLREPRGLAGDPGDDLPARLPDAAAARERRPRRRARPADRDDVTLKGRA